MSKLISIIKKNFQIVAYSKVSIILMVLGPILLMLFIGMGLADSGLKSVKASVYSENYDAEDTFPGNFASALGVNSFVVSEVNSLDDCLNSVKSSESSICIHLIKKDLNLPRELKSKQKDIESSGIGSEVKLYVDFSQPRTVWGLIAKVNNVVEKFSDGIRDESALLVRDSFNQFSGELNSESERVNLVLSGLKTVDTNLEQVSENMDSYDSSVENPITSIESSLVSLSTSAPLTSSQSAIILGAISSLSLVKGQIRSNDVSLATAKDSVLSVKNSIEGVVEVLENVRRGLNDLKKESVRAGELNWNYILHPIPMTYTGIGEELSGSNTELDFLDYLFPSLLSFFILLSSLFISSNLVIKENTSEANIRNSLGKTSQVTFFIGNFTTLLLIMLIQIAFLLFIASYFLGFNMFRDISALGIGLLLSIPTFIILGMLIANISKNQETSIISSISISLILIIFSSVITPLDVLPNFLKKIVSFSPVVITESLFRRLFIFESSLYQISDLIISLGVSIIVVCLMYLLFSKIFKKEMI